jgi:hypothetical protein
MSGLKGGIRISEYSGELEQIETVYNICARFNRTRCPIQEGETVYPNCSHFGCFDNVDFLNSSNLTENQPYLFDGISNYEVNGAWINIGYINTANYWEPNNYNWYVMDSEGIITKILLNKLSPPFGFVYNSKLYLLTGNPTMINPTPYRAEYNIYDSDSFEIEGVVSVLPPIGIRHPEEVNIYLAHADWIIKDGSASAIVDGWIRSWNIETGQLIEPSVSLDFYKDSQQVFWSSNGVGIDSSCNMGVINDVLGTGFSAFFQRLGEHSTAFYGTGTPSLNQKLYGPNFKTCELPVTYCGIPERFRGDCPRPGGWEALRECPNGLSAYGCQWWSVDLYGGVCARWIWGVGDWLPNRQCGEFGRHHCNDWNIMWSWPVTFGTYDEGEGRMTWTGELNTITNAETYPDALELSRVKTIPLDPNLIVIEYPSSVRYGRIDLYNPTSNEILYQVTVNEMSGLGLADVNHWWLMVDIDSERLYIVYYTDALYADVLDLNSFEVLKNKIEIEIDEKIGLDFRPGLIK